MSLIRKVTDQILDGQNKVRYFKRIDGQFDFVGLMISRECHANCIFCPVHTESMEPRFMSQKIYNTVISELDDTRFHGDINFGENGDALLHPRFKQMFKKANRETHGSLMLYSNMGNMGFRMSRFVLEQGLNELTVNIDGASPMTYEASKKGLKYDVVEKNLLGFINTRDEIELFCKINISIIPPVRYQELRGNGSSRLNYDVSAIKKYWGQYLSSNDRISESSYFYNWANPSSGVRKSPCPMTEQLYHKLYVSVEGEVYPCCLDYKTQFSYGNVLRESLKGIWESDKRKRVIRDIVNMNYRNVGSPCLTCNEKNDFVESRVNQLFHRIRSWV